MNPATAIRVSAACWSPSDRMMGRSAPPSAPLAGFHSSRRGNPLNSRRISGYFHRGLRRGHGHPPLRRIHPLSWRQEHWPPPCPGRVPALDRQACPGQVCSRPGLLPAGSARAPEPLFAVEVASRAAPMRCGNPFGPASARARPGPVPRVPRGLHSGRSRRNADRFSSRHTLASGRPRELPPTRRIPRNDAAAVHQHWSPIAPGKTNNRPHSSASSGAFARRGKVAQGVNLAQRA